MPKSPKLRYQPMIVAWKEFRDSPEYESVKKLASDSGTVDAALWSVFETGWVSRRVVIQAFLKLSKEDQLKAMRAIGEPMLPWYRRWFRWFR